MTSRSPYQGTTRHSRDRGCGVSSEVVLDNGNRINVICTRWQGHTTTEDPPRHFDEVRRRSWYEDLPTQNDESGSAG
jgi:hypothetical protein